MHENDEVYMAQTKSKSAKAKPEQWLSRIALILFICSIGSCTSSMFFTAGSRAEGIFAFIGILLFGSVFIVAAIQGFISGESEKRREREFEKLRKQQEIPKEAKCPTCGSSDLERILPGSKVGAALTFGLFSLGHLSKTFLCRNCKYKW